MISLIFIIRLVGGLVMPKVKVVSEACQGCGLCIGSRPDVFEFDDEGHAKAVVEEVSDELGFECPFGAIEVE